MRMLAEGYISRMRQHPDWTPLRAGERIRVVFLVMTPQIWPSVEPVWRKLSADERFHTKVVAIEKTSEADALSELRGAYDLLTEANVPFAKGSSFSMHRYKPHVVFYPLPYDHFYSDQFKAAAAQAAGARVAYIHYGLETGGGAHNARYQHDEPLLRNAWRIFARSRHQAANFARYCATGNAHVVLTGHPRGGHRPDTSEQLPQEVLTQAKTRKIVLWAPHFSVASRRKWSSFLENHENILGEIDKRQDLFFVLRPHPFLERTLREAEGWTIDRVRALFDQIAARENIHIDRHPSYWPAFNGSDALMTDPGSFLVEYLHTDKPICLLSSSDGIGLGQEAAAFTAFENGDTIDDISRFLDMVSSGTDTKAADRKDALAAYFGDREQNPADLIAEEIVAGMSDRPFNLPNTKRSEKHRAAFRYWRSAKDTFLAPDEYYKKQEAILTDLLNRLKPRGFAIDVGCGNGRFTEIFARHCNFVEGIDPSRNLIEQAQESAAAKGITNIEYRRENLEQPFLISSYDLVACMGVLSGVIDNERFLQASHWLRAATKHGGRLILKESLSVGALQSIDSDGYVAVYRNITDYLDTFRSAGFELVEEMTIAPVNEQGLTNCLFVFDTVDRKKSA